MTAAIVAAGKARLGPRPWNLEKWQGGYLINQTLRAEWGEHVRTAPYTS